MAAALPTAGPAVLPLRRGDPLPPLPAGCGFVGAPGRWALLVSCGAADVDAAEAAALRALPEGGALVIFVHGADAAALTPPRHADAAGRVADLLGALADAKGRRATVLVTLEPRGAVWDYATPPPA